MSPNAAERLVLGTVQLGMAYGVANASGRPYADKACKIVDTAWQGGVRSFDTARDYGEAEAVLGKVFADLGIADDARVSTKFSHSTDHGNAMAMRADLEQSLKLLGVPRLDAVMLHDEALLDEWDTGLGERLIRFVEQGLVRRIGVSVYTPEAAARALKLEGISLIQLPTNPLDRRFENAGLFTSGPERGVEIHVRSIFLQGLLFMDPDNLPEHVVHAKTYLRSYRDLAHACALTPASLALGYARSGLHGAGVLFGAETPQQVTENISLWNNTLPDDLVREIRERFAAVPEKVLNPALWEA